MGGGMKMMQGGMVAVLLLTLMSMMHPISAQTQPPADPECCVYQCLDKYYSVNSSVSCPGPPLEYLGCNLRPYETAEACLGGCPILTDPASASASASNSSCATQCLAAYYPRFEACLNTSSRAGENCRAASSRARVAECTEQEFKVQEVCVTNAVTADDNCVRACPAPSPADTACRIQCSAAYYTGTGLCVRQTNVPVRDCLQSLQRTAKTCRDACSTPSTCPADGTDEIAGGLLNPLLRT